MQLFRAIAVMVRVMRSIQLFYVLLSGVVANAKQWNKV